jgi:integrase
MAVTAPKEVRVAPNIYKTPYGWRVYVRSRHPQTGKSRLAPVRFKADVTLEELEHFRDSHKLETRRLRMSARKAASQTAAASKGTFKQDAATYLELTTVKAMPSYKDRTRDVGLWVAIFGSRQRSAITTRAIDDQLQQWINDEYAASTVNNRRTALMSMYTRLDGRAAANPVRDTRVFDEPDLEARGLPYALVVRILDAIPAERSYSHLRSTKITQLKTRVRLEVMAWTGMRASQIGRLTRKDVNFEEKWFVAPRSLKGNRKPRHPRPLIRKPMTADAAAALRRFFELGFEGKFSASSARRPFVRAVKDVEKAIQKERDDPTFRLPAGIRPYDLRHSFGTEMLRRTKSLETVAELLDQTSTRMTKRYALGAVADVMREAATAFEAATTGGTRTPAAQRITPKAPRRRRGDGP